MDKATVISETESLCPICLKKIEAKKIKEGTNVYLQKECEYHGSFKTIIWRDSPKIESWIRNKIPSYPKTPFTEIEKGCPFDCGLCKEHRQHTCTALIEVTDKCNLNCSFCFANSGSSFNELTLEKIEFLYRSVLKSSGNCNIQISGGEPTVREDLPEIIRLGHSIGFSFIQLNTNGVRIAEEEGYLKELKEAGLNSIFLQFDGMDDSIYEKLRGKKLLNLKLKAIESCKKYNIGVILVPTLVPKINIDNIGAIIDFALENLPTVRGVHFQPVSYFGRIPDIPKDEDRVTIPEVIRAIEKQTGGRIQEESFRPPGCENSFCSFHGNYIYKGNGQLSQVTKHSSDCCCSSEKAEAGAEKAKKFVARNWSERNNVSSNIKMGTSQIMNWDDIIQSIKNYSFSISGMAFQDVWNIDLERVKDCCIHVVNPEGKLIPFCAYNLTDIKGNYLYRRRK
ncbi:radical SAM protein [Clostridium sp. A1-XYC3]|uniref:Radical SAM protein n=1 Tax=Clostridium tanneri TaxID=3037988 RepID=A0ABU4JX21_9CLOT|nr:radical SAM (seleno)protein TrsS [Clostridium sp. A1-XYC3]MDW8802683.1 radical SAM protein [Clostridium sp. A1-XYC3]